MVLAFWARFVFKDEDAAGWFVWDWLTLWFWELYWVLGCLSTGYALLTRALKLTELPAPEKLAAAMALGTCAFVLVTCVAGAFGLFNAYFPIVTPALFLLPAWTVRAQLRALYRRRRTIAFSATQAALCALGVIALLMVYLPVVSPGAVSSDASWFHLASAEAYAREGRIVPFLADWAKNLPQLTSIVHTWAFLVPGLSPPQHWSLALHTEFVLFVFTLCGVAATANWLLDGASSRVAWITPLLFPSIYIFDSNLNGSADHITAFFLIVAAPAALRALATPDWRIAGLAGVAIGAALLTKIQAVYVAVPFAVLFLGRATWVLFKRGEQTRRVLISTAVLGAGVVLMFSPHMVKAAIFHKNPFYPFAMNIFPSYPAPPDASDLFYSHLAPITRADRLANLERAAKLLFTFPFEVKSLFGTPKPFIGALFTLFLPAALFPSYRRVPAALFVACCAVMAWAYTFPAPRNLQVYMPLLAAIAAALIARTWASNWIGRLAVLLIIVLQVAASSAHVVSANQGIWVEALNLARSGPANRYEGYRREYRAVGAEVPEDAVLLMHTSYSVLGINRRTLLDWPGFQGLIDYRPMKTPRDVYDRLVEVGVTHIATADGWPAHSRQEEVLFDAFLYRYAKKVDTFPIFSLWKMPSKRPPAEEPYSVVLLGLPRQANGLYRVEQLDQLDDGRDLDRPPLLPLNSGEDVEPLLNQATSAVIALDFALSAQTERLIERRFEQLIAYRHYRVLVARR